MLNLKCPLLSEQIEVWTLKERLKLEIYIGGQQQHVDGFLSHDTG